MSAFLKGRKRSLVFAIPGGVFVLLLLAFFPITARGSPQDVTITEIGWGGTGASPSDGWIELKNNTTAVVNLANWSLVAVDGTPAFSLTGSILPGGYFILEYSHDMVISDVPADMLFVDPLDPGGETLVLYDDAGLTVDTVNADGGPWPGGDASTPLSMERTSPTAPDSDANWTGNNPLVRNGLDSLGNPVSGTPRAKNSCEYAVLPGQVVVNEAAWSGGQWIELYNNTAAPIILTDWSLVAVGGTPAFSLTGVIPAGGFFLLEQGDDNTVSDVAAGGVYTGLLPPTGDRLRLYSDEGLLIDTANSDGGAWPAGTDGAGTPPFASMERTSPTAPDSDASWQSNNGFNRNGTDAGGSPINGTPGQPNSTTIHQKVLIGEFIYDALTPSTEGDEMVEICNPIPLTVDLQDYKVGDEEACGGSEGMYLFPAGVTLPPGGCIIIAKNAGIFAARFGFSPDFEMIVGGSGYADDPAVPNLGKYTACSAGNWALDNTGDEIVLLGPSDTLIDAVAFAGGDYAALALTPSVSAPQPESLQRLWPQDTDSMPADFIRGTPNPGVTTTLPPPPAAPPPAAPLGGMWGYFGLLCGHTSYSDGAGPPSLAYATARANGLHFLAVSDADHALNAAFWADTGARAADAAAPSEFVALRGFEYAGVEGHITVLNTVSYVSGGDPACDSLPEFYAWLAAQPAALAGFVRTPAGTYFDNFSFEPAASAQVALFEVESGLPATIYEGQWRYAQRHGWQLGAASGVHAVTSNWGADSTHRTGIVATGLTEAELLDAIRARRTFSTGDSNFALALQANGAWMGTTIPTGPASFTVYTHDPDDEATAVTLYDLSAPVASTTVSGVSSTWSVPLTAQPGHFYWARAVQSDGDIAYTSPVRVAGDAEADAVILNEILPAPHDNDWDGSGVGDSDDEWIELANLTARPVNLRDWQLSDAVSSYVIGDVTIPPGGYATFYRKTTGIALNNGGDTVTLLYPDGVAADAYTYDHDPGDDRSTCRIPDSAGGWAARCRGTPNAPNASWDEGSPLHVKIFEARRLSIGALVTLHGRVTAPPGLFGYRVMYIQDDTSGIRVYLPSEHRLYFDPGDDVEVTGKLGNYHDELQIKVSGTGDVSSGDDDLLLPPMQAQTHTSMSEGYEGVLLELAGTVVEIERRHFCVDDGTGWSRVYIHSNSGIHRPKLEIGMPVRVVGVLSQYDKGTGCCDGYRLMPRYRYDIITPDTPPVMPAFLPETGGVALPGITPIGHIRCESLLPLPLPAVSALP